MTLPLQRSFDDLGIPLYDVTFCVVDLETTGGSPTSCEITEIGAVKTRGGVVEGTFQTLVDPGAPIPPMITVLTGITQAMVIEAPRIEEVLPAFLEFCGDAVVVGHNVRFDLGFLNAAAERLGYGVLRNRSVDTVGLARRLVRSEVRNLKLASLAAHFRSPVAPTHRALDDARATVHVFHGLLERAGGLGVTALEDLLQLPTARGSAHYRKIHLARELPRGPGVYLFRDRDGTVIYVGKAKNLRTRVASYFYGDERRSVTDLLRQLESIDHRRCAGDLEASVTELRLIHAHRPRHNRRSRPPKASHFVTLTRERFPRLSLTRTIRGDALATLGPFRSRRSAELVMTALWDAVPVRRCTGRPGSRSGRCAPAQLGVALCPCDGSLADAEYRPVVERIVSGILDQPDAILHPLVERMHALSLEQRYEEAGWVRDRHRALARAIERSRSWRALLTAGRMELVSDDGEAAVIEDGRLVAAWPVGGSRPLLPLPSIERDLPIVPPDVAVAEEVDLVWKWMTSPGVRLMDVTGDLALPGHPVSHLPSSPRPG